MGEDQYDPQKVRKAYDLLTRDDTVRVRCMRFTVYSTAQMNRFTAALTGSGCFWTALPDPDPARGVGLLVTGSHDEIRLVLERILGS